MSKKNCEKNCDFLKGIVKGCIVIYCPGPKTVAAQRVSRLVYDANRAISRSKSLARERLSAPVIPP